LIAPLYVEFYAADWSLIGTKLERYEEIAEITTIKSDLLAQNKSMDIYTAGERFPGLLIVRLPRKRTRLIHF